MSIIIEINDRQDDVDFLTPKIREAARGGYVVGLEVDDHNGHTVFEGDVVLSAFDHGDVLVGREYVNGTQLGRVEVDVVDIRRIEFY